MTRKNSPEMVSILGKREKPFFLDFGYFWILNVFKILGFCLLEDMRRQWPPEAGGVVRMQLSDLQDASGVSRSDFDDDRVGFELIQNFAMGIFEPPVA